MVQGFYGKILVVVWVAGLFLASATPVFSQENLLTNGGFEDLPDQMELVGWETHNSKITLAPSSVFKEAGQYSAQVETLTSSTNYIYQVVEVSPNTNYYADAHGLKKSGTSVFLRIAWYESLNGIGSQISTSDSGSIFSNSDSFEHIYTDTLTSPPNAKSAAIRLVASPGAGSLGTAFFDVVGFYQGVSPYGAQEDREQEGEMAEPAVVFTLPRSVAADTPFKVNVELKDFEPGTYAVKVLVGVGDKFYDGRTKGTGGEWLAWNAGWADFPTIAVNSSRSGSETIEAKTDDDVVAGEYLVKVRLHTDSANFDSEPQDLKVTVKSVSPEESEKKEEKKAVSFEAKYDDEETAGAAEGGVLGGGEVLGEEAPLREGSLELNFYVILGIFGVVVGSGGLVVAFRGVQSAEYLEEIETLS